jgi:hypothetical protein
MAMGKSLQRAHNFCGWFGFMNWHYHLYLFALVLLLGILGCTPLLIAEWLEKRRRARDRQKTKWHLP